MIRAVALLGEIDENPLVLDYETLEERLRELLEDLNQAHAPALEVPLLVPGEVPEFLAVLRDLGTAYPISRALAEALHPLPVRIGACAGEVNVPDPLDAEQIDGPAFDGAAELLYRARKEDRLLMIRGDDPSLDQMANALFLVLYRHLQTWTDRQCEVVRLYRNQGRQRQVAAALGVSQQSVSSSLAAAGWKSLAEAEAALEAVFPRGRTASPSR